ncbi:hypothetical protein N5C66_22565 [Rhizobium pusense]|uniref:hypothetical protein n=1 Tax=Agrobacterium pusense TaxID=648995 RepID=UPI000D1A3104|nr:hypothetical protein [Agrobacterium pusense]MDH0910479.1 hypothetical protein [Agrobacterium pusense]MDH1098406.1 hypothetical protein [Agrobacterium pusense]MDH1114516.1 hypothetical protein [Agrobacterium pusense]MDH2195720.1 hypothetical protein [Agrobacterium pusense]
MQIKGHKLISLYGQIGSIKRAAAPDPVYGGKPIDTWYTVRLVPIAYDAGFVDGAVILSGDVQIYISSAGLAIVPGPGDYVIANGKQYAIINGDPQNYDGVTNIVFVVQARHTEPA